MVARIGSVVLMAWSLWLGVGCGSGDGGCKGDDQCAVGVCEAGICVECRSASDCDAEQDCLDHQCVDQDEQCQGAASCGDHGTCDDSSGQIVCSCETGYAGDRCDACASGFHLEGGACVEDQVEQCQGAASCGDHGTCDDSSGQIVCSCETGYAGDRCDACATGYHLEGGACVEDQGGDLDGDGVLDGEDNCPAVANAEQTNSDDDALGDACDEDDDNDGVLDSDDCNPTDASIGHCALFYADVDNDSFGDPAASNCACAPAGDYTSTSPTDCNDADAAIMPGALEQCDGIDQNCNGIDDEGFDDGDQDGQADCVDPDDDGDGVDDGVDDCPSEYNPDQSDIDADGAGDACDEDDDGDGVDDPEDNCPFVDNPGQEDVDNNGVGDVCDDDRDGDSVANDLDNCPDLPNLDQLDFDDDQLGDACDDDDDSDGIADVSDCAPMDATIYPGAQEACNQIDDDCDAATDEGQNATGCDLWYLDADTDGHGSMIEPGRCYCQATGQYAAEAADDCDDSLPAVKPGAAELCNGRDDNCVDGIDELWPTVGSACDGTADADECEDGTVRCNAQGDGTYCDDGASTPGGVELCNGGDDDCDGQVDETWPTLGQPCDGPDADHCAEGVTVCNASQTGTACVNDLPAHVEICNGQDDDCDGSTDEGCDDDNDDYCDQNMTIVGTPATCGHGGLDCNDGNASIHPDATEVCDGLDNDCDGATDENGPWPSQSGDASDVVLAPTAVGAIISTAVVSPGAETFWRAVDLDYYSWSAASQYQMFWICRVTDMSPSMRVRIVIGYRDANTPAGWTASTTSGVLANNGSVVMSISPHAPYVMLGGVLPSSGISGCFSEYTLECKMSGSNVW